MKNFGKFVLAVYAALVFGLGWPVIWGEIALGVFAVLAVLGESKRIAVLEVTIPIIVIILVHQKPDWWMVCVGVSIFLAVWNVAEWVAIAKEKIR